MHGNHDEISVSMKRSTKASDKRSWIGEFHASESRQFRQQALMTMVGVRLCSDPELMRNIWARYDGPALEQHSGSKVFLSLITALNRLLTEKPALLGVGTQMFGIGVASGEDAGASAAEMVAGMVATAASGVVGMIGSGTGLSMQGSAMKLKW